VLLGLAEKRALSKFSDTGRPIYYRPIVTYDVIFWPVNFRNIINGKVNVGIFTYDVDIFHGLFIIILYTWGNECVPI